RGGEAAVEAHDVVIGIARGGGQKAHARACRGGEREDVVVEQRAVALHRETSPSEGDDLRGLGSHCLRSCAYALRRAATVRDRQARRYGLASRLRGSATGHPWPERACA